MTASFESMFDTFSRYAWRLEVRDEYAVPGTDEHLATWRATGTVAPSPGWSATIRAALARGATIGRVRLVGHPIAEYTRFEFDAYRNNVAAGENVQVIDRRWLDQSWHAAPDFWVFDDEVWLMRYTATGDFIDAIHVDDPAPYLQIREQLSPYAVAASDYQLDVPAPRTETITVPLPAELATAS